MKIKIDDRQIEARAGISVLEAALEAGIFIPHICSHPDLEASGGCRLCVVEVDGKVLPSCQLTVEEGLSVSLKSPNAEKVRKMAMELILATHPADCTGCPKYGKCELQSMFQYMGVSPERWKMKARPVATDDTNPLITHMFTRCIRCGRCVRACRELRGVKVIDFQKTGEGVKIGTTGGISLKEAGCRFCGACIEVCPTGAIVDALESTENYTNRADGIVPCRAACPAGIEIPRYIRAVYQGDFAKAAAIAREKVPFPEILGSICEHPCEEKCKRGALGEPVSICRLKRAAGAYDDRSWKKRVRTTKATGKKAAIIGAGPAGLTAAYYLSKKGHEVTVFEARNLAGGQCRYGIPAYRLPDELLDKEIADITAEGVKIITNRRIGSVSELLAQGYQTVLIAGGTHEGIRLNMEGSQLPGVFLNTEFLRMARTGELTKVGEKIMVLGGGNVAYDCARTAIRMGAKRVFIACLEERERMTAAAEEITEGEEEGIELLAGNSFLRISGTDWVEGVELQAVEKFYFDENRKAIIELKEGTKQMIAVDTVIFAVGQRPERSEEYGVELVRGNYLKIDENYQTSIAGVYAAGDVVTGTRSVIEAIAAGRQCAVNMDIYLGGDGDISEVLTDREKANPYIGRIESFAEQKRVKPDCAAIEIRRQSFGPIEKEYEPGQAQVEANRCLQCDLRLDITRPKLWTEY